MIDWTHVLINAAKQTHLAVKDLLGTEFARELISRGAGGDITAKIDQIAEETFISHLQETQVPFVMISEEIGMFHWDGKHSHPLSTLEKIDTKTLPIHYIILDPVDGSSNAMRGIPFSCISVAYASGPRISDIKIGVLVDLQTGDLYVAELGKGAYLNNVLLSCSNITQLSKVVMGTDLDSSIACRDIIIRRETLFDTVSKRRILGSCALELGMIGSGVLDLYFDIRGVLRIVDIAAGILIVKEAGGFVINAQGLPLEDSYFDLLPKYDLIAGCPGIKDEMIRILHEN